LVLLFLGKEWSIIAENSGADVGRRHGDQTDQSFCSDRINWLVNPQTVLVPSYTVSNNSSRPSNWL